MAYSLSRAEMETTIRWDALDKVAHIYTCDPSVARKLNKLVSEHPDIYTRYKDDFDCTRYLVNAKYIRFGKPASEELRAKRRELALQRGLRPPRTKDETTHD